MTEQEEIKISDIMTNARLLAGDYGTNDEYNARIIQFLLVQIILLLKDGRP